MKQKLIAGLTTGAVLLAVAPLAFAQTYSNTSTGSGNAPITAPTVPGTPNTGTGASSGTTGTSGSSTTGTGSTSGTGTSGSTTPGVPNTGAGGDATTNAIVLTLSGLIAVGGIGYLATRKSRIV